tara:strand:+ start:292 stop:1044 length:753 start_codon:yes stop_codon:yes gene_type:complete
MGVTESLTVSGEETGALSPEQEAAQTQEQTQEQPQEQPQSERPEWLPEKFNSPEDMAKAYGELESKQSGKQTEESDTKQDLSIPELSEKDMNYYSQRFAENGQLDEEDYSGLEKLGVSKDMVNAYIQGQAAMQQQYTQTVYNEVGGQESYQAMTEWASNSLTPEEIAVYDEAVNSGDTTKTMSAVKGLQARYQLENGTQPNLMQGKTTGTGVQAYESLDQMKREMQDPRYASDPAFRESVQRKLAVSNIF